MEKDTKKNKIEKRLRKLRREKREYMFEYTRVSQRDLRDAGIPSLG